VCETAHKRDEVSGHRLLTQVPTLTIFMGASQISPLGGRCHHGMAEGTGRSIVVWTRRFDIPPSFWLRRSPLEPNDVEQEPG